MGRWKGLSGGLRRWKGLAGIAEAIFLDSRAAAAASSFRRTGELIVPQFLHLNEICNRVASLKERSVSLDSTKFKGHYRQAIKVEDSF